MILNVEKIQEWLSSKEDHSLEFKEAKDNFEMNDLCKYCVAIANEGGGFLVLGISDSTPRKVVGSNAFKDKEDIEKRLLDALKFRVDTQSIIFQEKRILVFVIPPRPSGTAYNYKGSFWMRHNSILTAMTEDYLRKIFSENLDSKLNEIIYKNMNIDKFLDLIDVENYFKLISLPRPVNKFNVIDRLIIEKLIEIKNDEYCMKYICALLLAKNLENFEGMARKSPRLIIYEGKNKIKTKEEINFNKGLAVGFENLIETILNKLPRYEFIEKGIRKTNKICPDDVIRELVANAIIHQDLTIIGISPTIEIYQNRVEITNPGIPLININRFIDTNRSRNERMAELMRKMGICEERGSGIDKVVNQIEELRLPAPNFKINTENNSMSAIIFGFIDFNKMDYDDRIRACYHHCCLRYIQNEYMTNESLRSRFNLEKSKIQTVSQIISQTVEKKLIKPDPSMGNSKKYARYIPEWS